MRTIKQFLIILIFIQTTTILLFAESNTTVADKNLNYILKNKFKKQRNLLLKHIDNKRFLKRFYKKNNYLPLWINEHGLKREKYLDLINHINKDLTLNKNGFLLKKSEALSKQLDNNLTNYELYRVELKLTSLYHDFLNHAIYGEIQWKSFSRKLSALKRYRINAKWLKSRAKFNLNKLISQPDINKTIEEITPKRFGYKKLLEGLNILTTIKENGGWLKLPYFKVLELGSRGEIVVQLRERLKASGDYTVCENNTTILNTPIQHNKQDIDNNESTEEKHIDPDAIFGNCLDIAVKKFQKRHGLTVDGIVGGGTQRALNTSVEEKIKTVLLNIDRIKWLPRDQEQRYLVVNLPEFKLHYIEDNIVKQQLRVVIGDKKHPTPIFNQKISYIVLNPYWKVPEGIVRREIIPAVVRNRNYLRKQGLVAHRTWDENSRIINTSHIYWKKYLWSGVKFPYRLMQPPGPKNALGKIKFKFPNQFAVYLHDTPSRHLFKKNIRAFSHGCVRLDQPQKLLDTVASFNKSINLPRARKILKGKRKVQLNIKNKLPIYLVYLTAGMNNDNQLEFRNDIYRYDKFMKRSTK